MKDSKMNVRREMEEADKARKAAKEAYEMAYREYEAAILRFRKAEDAFLGL